MFIIITYTIDPPITTIHNLTLFFSSVDRIKINVINETSCSEEKRHLICKPLYLVGESKKKKINVLLLISILHVQK
jgi:hypothetical protein